LSSIKEFISHCSNCGKNTTFIENRINHILHAILSIFLLGTWLIVWLCLIIFKDKKTQCKVCGTPPVKGQKLDNIAKKTSSITTNMIVIAILGIGIVIILELTGIGENCEIKYLCRP